MTLNEEEIIKALHPAVSNIYSFFEQRLKCKCHIIRSIESLSPFRVKHNDRTQQKISLTAVTSSDSSYTFSISIPVKHPQMMFACFEDLHIGCFDPERSSSSCGQARVNETQRGHTQSCISSTRGPYRALNTLLRASVIRECLLEPKLLMDVDY